MLSFPMRVPSGYDWKIVVATALLCIGTQAGKNLLPPATLHLDTGCTIAYKHASGVRERCFALG